MIVKICFYKKFHGFMSQGIGKVRILAKSDRRTLKTCVQTLFFLASAGEEIGP
jgi:hypothetical protein